MSEKSLCSQSLPLQLFFNPPLQPITCPLSWSTLVAHTGTVTNNINFIFLITKKGKISQKHAQMYLRPIMHCAMNMKIIVFKLNWVTLYWWEKKREAKTNNKERQKYKAKQTLRQEKKKKKERVADEQTDQRKHYLLYVIFILRNQVKASLVIMDGRLGWPLFRTMWFWLRWL